MSGQLLGTQHFATAQESKTRRSEAQLAELEAIGRMIERCADELLDFNPMLKVMAHSLHEAIELEVSARRLTTE